MTVYEKAEAAYRAVCELEDELDALHWRAIRITDQDELALLRLLRRLDAETLVKIERADPTVLARR